MLRNGCRVLLLQQARVKPSRSCRLCCANEANSKKHLHTTEDKHFKSIQKGRGGHIDLKKKRDKIKSQHAQQTILFQPVQQEPLKDDGSGMQHIGEEIAGKLISNEKSKVLKELIQDQSLQVLAAQHDLEGHMYETAMSSFRKFCLLSDYLPPEIHVIFKNILQGTGHIHDLFPFFLNHAQTVYPHLNCMDDLRQISDLSDPSTWYSLARSIKRKVIYHAGPTNSGKTYHALKRFMDAESGAYCGPLRLLAMEVYDKCNENDVPCDLVTGETRMFAREDGAPSNQLACTVEMMNTSQEYDVAVIDEIQMIGDLQRGWAWTRALLGVAAHEVHVCGEETAIDLVRNLLETTGDEFEVKRYERLTSLTYIDDSLGSFSNIQPGDCIVCFSKKDIFRIYNILRRQQINCAVIYGDLPPGTKIMQSKKFNDPDDPCNVMVATDAVGMGLNLAIKRMIFYSVTKKELREDGHVTLSYLTTSQAQQIAGRAGRFRTQFEHGEVTTFWEKDLKILKKIVEKPKPELKKAGMNPTAEMIEMFSYHLPKASLSNLLDIFVHVSKLDDLYFMCNLTNFKELAKLIERVPLSLRVRYTLCSSPLKVKKGFAQVMFVKIARQIAQETPITFEWLCSALGAPFKIPQSVAQLELLEAAFDIVDIYLWLSYRYPDMFVDADEVRELRVKLDSIIQTFLADSRFKKPMKKLERSDIFDIDDKQAQADDLVVNQELIDNNPLQAYKPKPKSKKDRVFAEATNDMYGIENEVNRLDHGVTLSEENLEAVDGLEKSELPETDSADTIEVKIDDERMKLFSQITGTHGSNLQTNPVKPKRFKPGSLDDDTVLEDNEDDADIVGMNPEEVDRIKDILTKTKTGSSRKKAKSKVPVDKPLNLTNYDVDSLFNVHFPPVQLKVDEDIKTNEISHSENSINYVDRYNKAKNKMKMEKENSEIQSPFFKYHSVSVDKVLERTSAIQDQTTDSISIDSEQIKCNLDTSSASIEADPVIDSSDLNSVKTDSELISGSYRTSSELNNDSELIAELIECSSILSESEQIIDVSDASSSVNEDSELISECSETSSVSSDSKPISELSQSSSEDVNDLNNSQNLAAQLVQKGVLSDSDLQRLKAEWERELKQKLLENDSTDDDSKKL